MQEGESHALFSGEEVQAAVQAEAAALGPGVVARLAAEVELDARAEEAKSP